MQSFGILKHDGQTTIKRMCGCNFGEQFTQRRQDKGKRSAQFMGCHREESLTLLAKFHFLVTFHIDRKQFVFQTQFVLYPLLLQPHTMQVNQHDTDQPSRYKQTEPESFTPVRSNHHLQGTDIPFTLVLENGLHLKGIGTGRQTVVRDFFSFIGHNPFLLIRIQAEKVFLEFGQIEQVSKQQGETAVLMRQVQFRGIKERLGQHHLPVDLLPNLYGGMVHFQVGKNHPSLFLRIIKAKVGRTEIGQHAVVSPEKEVLAKKDRAVASRNIIVIE